jgi:3',5'-cyclic-AMP phosphodiesterase
LIALDTQSFGNKGGFCRRRIEHLTRLIQADTTRPIAVFTHHPPLLVTEGPDPFHFENRGAMSMLSNVLGRSRRVVAIFSGHVHRAASGDVDGIPAMVMTATATTLRRCPRQRDGITVRHRVQAHFCNKIGPIADVRNWRATSA